MRLSTAFFILASLLLGLPVAGEAAAQTSCAPYCDYTHYYGPFDLTYRAPGLFCYPRCAPDGSCAPYSACVSSRRVGRITVRSLSGVAPRAVAVTPTSVTYYDPSFPGDRVVPRRLAPRSRR